MQILQDDFWIDIDPYRHYIYNAFKLDFSLKIF
jgi:hypothetical protein